MFEIVVVDERHPACIIQASCSCMHFAICARVHACSVGAKRIFLFLWRALKSDKKSIPYACSGIATGKNVPHTACRIHPLLSDAIALVQMNPAVQYLHIAAAK